MNRQQNKHVIPNLKPHTITRTLADFFLKSWLYKIIPLVVFTFFCVKFIYMCANVTVAFLLGLFCRISFSNIEDSTEGFF